MNLVTALNNEHSNKYTNKGYWLIGEACLLKSLLIPPLPVSLLTMLWATDTHSQLFCLSYMLFILSLSKQLINLLGAYEAISCPALNVVVCKETIIFYFIF